MNRPVVKCCILLLVLSAAKLFAGAWSGAVVEDSPQPKDKEAKALFKKWQDGARADGKIPGGALGPLARTVAKLVELRPRNVPAPELAELLKKIDMSHDWTQRDAVRLLDDVTATYAPLLKLVESQKRFPYGDDIQKGQPLPAALKDAPWGKTDSSGLRMAWLLEPRAEQYPVSTKLKGRILFHNAGKDSVLFRALKFYQSGGFKARDLQGAEIGTSSVFATGGLRMFTCRLAPGEVVEVMASGIGIGPIKHDKDWQGMINCVIDAKEGDNVTLTPGPVSVDGWDNNERPKGEPGWWLDFITDRLSLDAPLPADAAERTRLLDRAMRHLLGAPPTAEEIAAFVSDREPTALDSLAKRLAKRPGCTSFRGSLTSGPTKFRVPPLDPDASKKLRTATNPGRNTLGERARQSDFDGINAYPYP